MNDQDLTRSWRSVTASMRVTPTAYSVDGTHVQVMAPLDAGLRSGGFAIVDSEAEGGDRRLVVQLRGVDLSERQVAEFDIDPAALEGDAGLIRAGRIRPRIRVATFDAVVVGGWDGTSLDTSHRPEGFGESAITPADPATAAAILERLGGDAPSITVGSAAAAEPGTAAARLRSTGFSRHTFLCGQSGSGKTYTTGVLLERLIEHTDLPLVILDPNSDHILLDRTRDDADGPEATAYRARAGAVRVARGRGAAPVPGDERHLPLRVHFSDLSLHLQALLLRLDPIADLTEYHSFTALSRSVTAPYSLHELADAARNVGSDALALRIANLGIAEWGLWCRPGESSLTEDGPLRERGLVVDLGSLALPEERAVVSLAVLDRLWNRRRERTPCLVVIDEAHNVVPAETDDPVLGASRDLGVLIAGEGRKFGLHLLVATQRPGKVHPNVVSQCDNLVLLRMNSAADVHELTGLFSHVPAGLIVASPEFKMGTALFAGPVAPTPLLARIGGRLTLEGGADVPTTWAVPAG